MGYLRPFRLLMCLLDKPEIGRHQSAAMQADLLLFAVLITVFLLRCIDNEQRVIGGGQSLLQLLSRDAGGGNHHQVRAHGQPASRVRLMLIVWY